MTDDRSAISDLVYTYAERIDLGDFDGLADLFTHAVVSGGEDFVRKGRDEVLAMYVEGTRRYEDNGTPHTKHVTTNLMV
ncbi:MAG TPA: nuclear transport factor 2 family protein, partial [Acidimicrobiales bacterium]|nr:nuclear transport factor 2 family protein [Acidimicrobiales bacterium]